MKLHAPPYTLKIVQYGSAPYGQDFEWYDLDQIFSDSGSLPDLKGAPIASWVLARLRRLIHDLPTWSDERNDGGGFCFDFDVEREGQVVASIQLQGDSMSPVVLGRGDAEVGEALKAAFVAALLSDPTDVEECCYRIVDPEWQEVPDGYFPPPTADSLNEYGWKPHDGFLGADNIKEDT